MYIFSLEIVSPSEINRGITFSESSVQRRDTEFNMYCTFVTYSSNLAVQLSAYCFV